MLRRFLVKHCSEIFGAIRKDIPVTKHSSKSTTWSNHGCRYHSDSSPPANNKLPPTFFSHVFTTKRDGGLSLKINGAIRSSAKTAEQRVQKQDTIDSLGTWNTTTDLPLVVNQSITTGKPIPTISTTSIGVSSVMGRRPYNEDQYGFQQLNESLLYFAVFDGHGGANCAKFCSNLFPKQVYEQSSA